MRYLLLLLAFLLATPALGQPQLSGGAGISGGAGLPAVAGLPTPIYTNSFERTATSTTDCSNDDGEPVDVTVAGSGNCEYTSGSIPEGSQVLECVSGDETFWANNCMNLTEGWIRFQFYIDSNTDPNADSEVLAIRDGASLRSYVAVTSTETLKPYCYSYQDQGDATAALNKDEWYWVLVHFWDHDGASGTPDMEVSAWDVSTLTLVTDSPASCVGTTAGGPIDGIYARARSTRGLTGRWDCFEVYDEDPGAPTTADCNQLEEQ